MAYLPTVVLHAMLHYNFLIFRFGMYGLTNQSLFYKYKKVVVKENMEVHHAVIYFGVMNQQSNS